MNFKRLVGVTAVLAIGLATAACGGSEDETGTIRILTLPIVDDGAVFYGIDSGIFKEHDVDVQIATTSGGNVGVPAMLGGSADMVMAGPFTALQSAAKGLPVRVVAAASTSLRESESEGDFYEVITGPDSKITSAEELTGTTMAVNVRGGTDELYTKAFLEAHGVDPESVKLVTLPFPDKPAALLSGRIDAAIVGAPFLEGAKAEGAKTLGYPYRTQENPVNPGSYVTTVQFAEDNPELLGRFTDALNEIVAEMEKPENRDAVLKSLSTHTGIDLDQLEGTLLPNFTPKINMEGLREMADFGQKYGLLPEIPDLDEVVLTTAK